MRDDADTNRIAHNQSAIDDEWGRRCVWPHTRFDTAHMSKLYQCINRFCFHSSPQSHFCFLSCLLSFPFIISSCSALFDVLVSSHISIFQIYFDIFLYSCLIYRSVLRYYTILYYTILYCTILYYIILYYTFLYYVVLFTVLMTGWS